VIVKAIDVGICLCRDSEGAESECYQQDEFQSAMVHHFPLIALAMTIYALSMVIVKVACIHRIKASVIELLETMDFLQTMHILIYHAMYVNSGYQ
jgi:ABC-type proline/glycine betaine transport system permease subunit